MALCDMDALIKCVASRRCGMTTILPCAIMSLLAVAALVTLGARRMLGDVAACAFVASLASTISVWLYLHGHRAFGTPTFLDISPARGTKPPGAVRFVAIADTHNDHARLTLPEGDVLLHAGDLTYLGTAAEVWEFNEWLGEQRFAHKLLIAGNHDIGLDTEGYDGMWADWHERREDPASIRALLTNATLLQEEAVTVMGVRVWGSAWQPAIPGRKMAYNLHTEAAHSIA